jgi:hypothetical protein
MKQLEQRCKDKDLSHRILTQVSRIQSDRDQVRAQSYLGDFTRLQHLVSQMNRQVLDLLSQH